jgi:hypothetical protein
MVDLVHLTLNGLQFYFSNGPIIVNRFIYLYSYFLSSSLDTRLSLLRDFSIYPILVVLLVSWVVNPIYTHPYISYENVIFIVCFAFY